MVKMSVTRSQILKLYKDINRYTKELKYTDKEYFLKRVRNQFKKNKVLDDDKEILFNYQVIVLSTIHTNQF